MSADQPQSSNDTRSQLDYQFKILLIGDSSVGKTSIMGRFTENKFNFDIKSTIGVEYSKKCMTVDNMQIQASIWDTAGQERFRALAKTYYKGALGALLVFDVTKQHTLDNIKKIWISEIKQNASENIKMVLIGNKADLEEERAVKKEEALEVAKEFNLAYLETSALNAQNIDAAFETIAKEILGKINVLPNDIRPKNLTVRKEASYVAGQTNFQLAAKEKQKKDKTCC